MIDEFVDGGCLARGLFLGPPLVDDRGRVIIQGARTAGLDTCEGLARVCCDRDCISTHLNSVTAIFLLFCSVLV